MWDKGWTKIYEVLPAAELSEEYQELVGERLAEIFVCLHPICAQLRSDVATCWRSRAILAKRVSKPGSAPQNSRDLFLPVTF